MANGAEARQSGLREGNVRVGRRYLTSGAEGTQANIGVVHRVVRAPFKEPRPYLSQKNRQRRRRGSAMDQAIREQCRRSRRNGLPDFDAYRPLKLRWDGPTIEQVAGGDGPPPNCPYCRSTCILARKLTSCDNIERSEEHWVCTKPSCVSEGRDVIVRRYPLGDYERRD